MHDAVSPTTSFDVDRLLKADGTSSGPLRLTMREGRVAAVTPIAAPSNGLPAMPAFADAHDQGRGLRTLAFGAVDDPLFESDISARNHMIVREFNAAVLLRRDSNHGITIRMPRP